MNMVVVSKVAVKVLGSKPRISYKGPTGNDNTWGMSVTSENSKYHPFVMYGVSKEGKDTVSVVIRPESLVLGIKDTSTILLVMDLISELKKEFQLGAYVTLEFTEG